MLGLSAFPRRMLGKLRGPLDKLAMPIGRFMARLGISANMVTASAPVVVGIGCLLVINGQRVLGVWIMIGGSLFDFVDGAIAKATNSQSKTGAFLDSTTDRLSDGILLATVAWILRDDPIGLAATLAATGLAFLVSYIRSKAEALGFTGNVGFAERAERLTLVAVGLVFDILVPMMILLAAVSLITVVHRFVHVIRQTRSYDRA